MSNNTCSDCGHHDGDHAHWCSVTKMRAIPVMTREEEAQRLTVEPPQQARNHRSPTVDEALAHLAIQKLFASIPAGYSPHQMGTIRVARHVTKDQGLVMSASAPLRIMLIATTREEQP